MQDPDLRSTVPRLIIDGNEIDDVKYVKLLGVTISSELTWNKHVENIVAKAGKRVYMLYQLKRAGIGQHDLVTIYVTRSTEMRNKSGHVKSGKSTSKSIGDGLH